jgi:hypothetical protein
LIVGDEQFSWMLMYVCEREVVWRGTLLIVFTKTPPKKNLHVKSSSNKNPPRVEKEPPRKNQAQNLPAVHDDSSFCHLTIYHPLMAAVSLYGIRITRCSPRGFILVYYSQYVSTCLLALSWCSTASVLARVFWLDPIWSWITDIFLLLKCFLL